METPVHEIAVSIVVPTYCPGDAISRVFDSLDALTLPRKRFEVIFVDDGSPDDTAERLAAYCAQHDNAQVHVIENSGWPSRPRNVALDVARGEYVLFMDHDDSLYPDGLRRAYEFAVAHGSDVVNAKECKTDDSWWSMDSQTAGNIVDIRAEQGVARLRELMPHKLYRRALLDEHDIRFPEGRSFLWEDWYVNVPAYRHGSVVSVFADAPLYLWHASETNATHTFDCAHEYYWDRLIDLFEHINSTLSPAEFDDDRLELVALNVWLRVIHRLARMLNRPEQEPVAAQQMAFRRSRELLERYGTPEVLARLTDKHLACAHLIRTGTVDQLRAFERADHSVQATAEVTDLQWGDRRLELDVTLVWRGTDAALAALTKADGRLRLDVGSQLGSRIPARLLDLTDQLDPLRVQVGVRDRFEHVTWLLPLDARPAVVEDDGTEVRVVVRGHVGIDLDTAASGEALAASIWDLRFRSEFYGMERTGRVGYRGGVRPAIFGAQPAVAYANNSKALSIDLGQHMRTLAVDAQPRPGRIGPIADFAVPLTAVTSQGTGRVPAHLAVLPENDGTADEPGRPDVDDIEALAEAHPFSAEIVVDDDGTAWLRGSGGLGPGDYRILARRREGLARTRFILTVNPAGGAHLIDEQLWETHARRTKEHATALARNAQRVKKLETDLARSRAQAEKAKRDLAASQAQISALQGAGLGGRVRRTGSKVLPRGTRRRTVAQQVLRRIRSR